MVADCRGVAGRESVSRDEAHRRKAHGRLRGDEVHDLAYRTERARSQDDVAWCDASVRLRAGPLSRARGGQPSHDMCLGAPAGKIAVAWHLAGTCLLCPSCSHRPTERVTLHLRLEELSEVEAMLAEKSQAAQCPGVHQLLESFEGACASDVVVARRITLQKPRVALHLELASSTSRSLASCRHQLTFSMASKSLGRRDVRSLVEGVGPIGKHGSAPQGACGAAGSPPSSAPMMPCALRSASLRLVLLRAVAPAAVRLVLWWMLVRLSALAA